MQQKIWTYIYRAALIVFLIALTGLLMQVKNIDTSFLVVVVILSGLLCSLAYKKSSDENTVDYAKMLDDSAAIGNSEKKVDPNLCFETSVNSSMIVGVIDYIAGSGIGRNWNGEFALRPWRIKNNPIQDGKLFVRLPNHSSKREYDRIVSKLSGDNVIVEVRVKEIVLDPQREEKIADLVEIVSIGVVDNELGSIALKRSMPTDLEFNGKPIRFSMDEEEGIFVGNLQWLGKDIRLYLDTDDSRQTQLYADDANELLANAPLVDKKLREKIAELLTEENRKLLRAEDRNKSPDAILTRLCLHDIHIWDDGELMFNFKEGDIFPNNEITVYGNLKEDRFEAELV